MHISSALPQAKNTRVFVPEQRLCIALLCVTLQDIGVLRYFPELKDMYSPKVLKKDEKHLYVQEALEYVYIESDIEACSFEFCCTFLGLDTKAFRDRLGGMVRVLNDPVVTVKYEGIIKNSAKRR